MRLSACVTKESFRGARGFIRVERLIQRFNSFHISGSVRCVSAWGKKLSLTGCLEVDNVFVCDILCMYAMYRGAASLTSKIVLRASWNIFKLQSLSRDLSAQSLLHEFDPVQKTCRSKAPNVSECRI